MPSTVAQLLEAAGLRSSGAVPWGTPPPLDQPGVYLVAATEDPAALVADRAPAIDVPTLEHLLAVRPELRLDGGRPSAEELAERLARCWLPDEPVVYLGLASRSVRRRVRDYCATPIGASKPHAGGWFVKALADLGEHWVHVAPAGDPKQAESDLLGAFCAGVSAEARRALVDPERPFPFANLEWPQGTRKRHGITGARGPLT